MVVRSARVLRDACGLVTAAAAMLGCTSGSGSNGMATAGPGQDAAAVATGVRDASARAQDAAPLTMAQDASGPTLQDGSPVTGADGSAHAAPDAAQANGLQNARPLSLAA